MPIRTLFLMGAALAATAATWPPIPADVWAMRNDPALVKAGAVVLEERLSFQAMYLEHVFRVRILGEAGRAAAEFHDLPAKITSLEGRVVYPDGKEVPITKRGDFLVREVASVNDRSLKEGVVIPPGVTSDCVLELRYREPGATADDYLQGRTLQKGGDLPLAYGNFGVWTLGEAFPVQKFCVDQAKDFYWMVWTMGTQGFDMKEESSGRNRTYTFRNLPASPRAPYSLESVRPLPKVVVFRLISNLAYLDSEKAGLDYWRKLVDIYYRPWWTMRVSKGSSYAALSREVREGLPAEPQAAARQIAAGLASRLANLETPIYSDTTRMKDRASMDLAEGTDLEGIARHRATNDLGSFLMHLHVLQDAGLHPKVALVCDRNFWLLAPDLRSPFQFTSALLGVDEPGKAIFWVDPILRLGEPGVLAARYQGTKAIVVDPANWGVAIQSLSAQPASTNARVSSFQVAVGEESAQVSFRSQLEGNAANEVRERRLQDSPGQVAEAWRRKMEQLAPGLALAKVEAENAQEPGKPLAFTGEGTLPLEPGRLLKVPPFPGMVPPLGLPPALPETRKEPVLLPYRSTLNATSRLTLPAGSTLRQEPPFSKINGWGQVSWMVQPGPGPGEAQVNLKINITGFYAPAESYQDFKDLLGWIDQALARPVVLERSGAAH
jgi:hypothetical protein